MSKGSVPHPSMDKYYQKWKGPVQKIKLAQRGRESHFYYTVIDN